MPRLPIRHLRVIRNSLIPLLAVVLVLGPGCREGDRPTDGPAAPQATGECARTADLSRHRGAEPPQVSSAVLEDHLRFLASDALQGRAPGTPGFDLAAQYVASCFSRFGFAPAGTDGYMQSVPLRRGVLTQASTLVLEGMPGGDKLVVERDFLPRPDLLRPVVEVTAPLVFVGFGVTAPDRAYDDYRSVDARGKIIVHLTGAPASLPATERAHYASSRMKLENAVRHGAVGVLVVRTRDWNDPWESIVTDSRRGHMSWLNPRGEPDGVFPQIRGAVLLHDSTAKALLAGSGNSLDKVLTAAEKGSPPTFDLPVRATMRIHTAHQRLESPNVAGLLRGSDPRLWEEVVVFTAHLDHLGVGKPVRGDSIYNGVLDNASGSAGLLEVARAFTRLPTPPRRSVLFLAVTAEEMGLLGSDYYAEYPTVPREKIIANLNLDGLAILYPLRSLVAIGAEHSTLDSPVQRAATRMGLRLMPDPFPEEVFFIRSDQYSFVRRGVPSLFLFLGFESDSGIDATGRFREWFRTRYHSPQDDLGQPMDLDAGAGHVQMNFLVGLDVANAEQRPAWKPGDFFGRTFGR